MRAWISYLISMASTAHLDAAIASPFSSCPALVAAASTRPGHMAKTAEKIKFDRYPHVNLVPFGTGRPGHHAKKFTNDLMRGADDPLHLPSETPGQPFRVSFTAPFPNNNSQLQPRDAWPSLALAPVPTVPLTCSSRVTGAGTVQAGHPRCPHRSL